MTNNIECQIKSDSSHGNHDYNVVELQRLDGSIYHITEKELCLIWRELRLYANDKYKKLGFNRIYYNILNSKINPMKLDCTHKDCELVDTGARIGKCSSCDWVMWESLF